MDRFATLLTAILAVAVYTASGQISTPCTVSMIASFTPCVSYVMGSSANGRSPTASCCKAVESLMTTSMDCTCLIVTGNVPFSLPSAVNQALAISLPKACNSKSVPIQCKSSGVPLPPAGPALFLPPPPRALPPMADSPEYPPSPSGSITTELAPTPAESAPTPSETSQDDLTEPESGESNPVEASAPAALHGPRPPIGSGIRPVVTPASASNRLQTSLPILLLMLAAITVTHFDKVFVF